MDTAYPLGKVAIIYRICTVYLPYFTEEWGRAEKRAI